MLDDRPDVDVAALETVLSRELGVEIAGIEVLADGLNRILSVSTTPARARRPTTSARRERGRRRGRA